MPGQANLIADHKTLIADITGQLNDIRPICVVLDTAVDAQLAVVREGNAVTVTVEMMRDGPEETVVTSMVELIEVGQDHAGKVLTSLVVKPGETPAGGNMGARWTGVLTMFRRALCEALSSSEEKLMVGGIATHVVDLETVRSEFYKTCVAHADGTDEKQDTRKKRFYRAVERAQILNLIGVRVEPSGRTLVWLAEAQAYAG